jgi:hypothetical protein
VTGSGIVVGKEEVVIAVSTHEDVGMCGSTAMWQSELAVAFGSLQRACEKVVVVELQLLCWQLHLGARAGFCSKFKGTKEYAGITSTREESSNGVSKAYAPWLIDGCGREQDRLLR